MSQVTLADWDYVILHTIILCPLHFLFDNMGLKHAAQLQFTLLMAAHTSLINIHTFTESKVVHEIRHLAKNFETVLKNKHYLTGLLQMFKGIAF
jgi:hypothetical protein